MSNSNKPHAGFEADLRSESASVSPQIPAKPQLLVSVSSVAEARLAMQLQVGWIDLKDPAAGALGAPSTKVARDVASCLSAWPQKSIALGELRDWPRRNTLTKSQIVDQVGFIDAVSGFQVAKFGLAGMKHTPQLAAALLEAAELIGPSVSLVPVIYGDHETCNAPPPDLVVEAAVECGARYILVDTFEKTGKSLLDYLPRQEIDNLVASAHSCEIQVVLAGSLKSQHLPCLWEIGADAIGIRGAVTTGTRTESICKDKLAEWVAMFTDVDRSP